MEIKKYRERLKDFKVGDRVEVLKYEEIEDVLIGETGIVARIDKDSFRGVLVDFEKVVNYENGVRLTHNADGTLDEHRGYWFNINARWSLECLEIIGGDNVGFGFD